MSDMIQTPHINAPAGAFAETVLMPGDPLRAKYIAENYFENPVLVNNVRCVQGYTGTWHGKKISALCATIPVYVYTDAPAAELFVNGKSQGKRTKDKSSRLDRFRLRWNDVAYEPGELRAVATYPDGSSEVACVRTAGAPAAISIVPDDGEGASYAVRPKHRFFEVSICDADGNLCPDAAIPLSFEVAGGARFKAVCNGDATSLEPFTKPTMKLFGGKLVVVVEAGQDAGDITLTVTAPKRKIKQTITLSVK